MRNEIEHRPALCAAVGLAFGIASGAVVFLPLLFVAFLLFIKRFVNRVTAAGGFLVGVILYGGPPADTYTHRQDIEAIVTVSSVPRLTRTGSSCEVEWNGLPHWMYWTGEPSLSMGARVRASGTVGPLRSRFLGSSQVGSIQAKSVEVIESGPSVLGAAAAIRDSFVRFSHRSLPEEWAQAVDALCFNVDARLDDRVQSALTRSGLRHIVSVSGLHVVILAVGLMGALSVVPIPRPAQLLLLALLLSFYAMATGLRPPVVRAVLMAMLMLSAYLLRREGDLLCALSISAIVYLLFRPESLFNPGFQLSFVTVAGLGLWLQYSDSLPTQPVRRLFAQCKQTARASFVASLCSAPLVAFHFGIVSLISVLSNVLVVIVLPFIVMGALLAFGMSPVAPALAQGTMTVIVGPLTGWVLFVTESLGTLSVSAVNVPEFNALWLILLYAPLILFWRRRVRPA